MVDAFSHLFFRLQFGSFRSSERATKIDAIQTSSCCFFLPDPLSKVAPYIDTAMQREDDPAVAGRNR
jgi:hypothetical protein